MISNDFDRDKCYVSKQIVNFQIVSHGLFIIYGLLTKLVRSRWLDIGQVLLLRVHKHEKKNYMG